LVSALFANAGQVVKLNSAGEDGIIPHTKHQVVFSGSSPLFNTIEHLREFKIEIVFFSAVKFAAWT
jgi:hypothetical protein